MNAEKIRRATLARGITSLYHFTPLSNLESIMRFGLVSRSVLDAAGAPYVYTDSWRNDGRLDALSLSIHDINRSMFAAKVKTSSCAWAILEIDASVLWDLPCRFCRVNAASSEIVRHSGFLGGPWAFAKMFEDCPVSAIDDRSFRETHGRAPYRPTRNDAEVQVLRPIGPGLIRDVTVSSEANRIAAFLAIVRAGRVVPVEIVPEAFG